MTDSIIRNVQLDLIMGNNNNPIIEYFNSIWKGLKPVTLSVFLPNTYTEIIYYNSEKESIFYMDYARGNFYCNEYYIREFRKIFNIDERYIERLTEILISDKTQTNIIALTTTGISNVDWIASTYNHGVVLA